MAVGGPGVGRSGARREGKGGGVVGDDGVSWGGRRAPRPPPFLGRRRPGPPPHRVPSGGGPPPPSCPLAWGCRRVVHSPPPRRRRRRLVPLPLRGPPPFRGPPFAFRRRSFPGRRVAPHGGALGASRDACDAAAVPSAVSSSSSSCGGGSVGSRGGARRPARASRRPPWTVLRSGGRPRHLRPPARRLSLSHPGPPPASGASGPGSGSPLLRRRPRRPPPLALPAHAPLPAAGPPPPSVARRGPGRGCGEGRGSAGRVFSPKARRGGGSRGCSSEARGSGRPRPRWLLGAGERPGREREAGCRAVAGPASRRPPGPGPSRAGSVGGLAPLAWRCRPRPAGGEDRRRGGGGGGLWPRSPAPRLARPPPPSVQVPSASRRGGLKTLWGSPVRLGSGRSGPRGGSVPSSRLRRLGPRHPVGCAGGGVATPRARSTRPPGGGSPPARWPSCRVRVRVRPPPPPRPRCGVGRGRWEPPGRLWGCPRSPPAPARARRGRRPDAPSFVRPFRPCRSLISWSLLAGQRRPPGMCRAREGGSPLRSKLVRLLAVDHSARASMKNAASCEN